MRLPRIKIEEETEEPAEIPQEAETPPVITEAALEPEPPAIAEAPPEPPAPEPSAGQLTPSLELDPVGLEPDEAAESITIHEATSDEEIVTGEFTEAVPDLNWDAVIDGESPETPAAWEPYAAPEEPSRLAAIRAMIIKRALPIAVLIVMIAALILVPLAIRRGRQSAGSATPQSSDQASTKEASKSSTAGPTHTSPTATPIGPTPTPLPPWAQGRIVYASNADGDFDLVRLDFATGTEKVLTVNEAADRSPAWSPDGRRIVYVSDLFGIDDLFVINADGTGLVQLTSSFALDHNPVWSPDGLSILFSREDVNGSSLIRLDTSCINDAPPQSCEDTLSVITTGSYDLYPEWSPDQSRIAFANSAGPGDPLRIALIAASGSGFTTLPGTNSSDFAPVWSPDGTRLLFVSYLQGDDDLWMMNPDGSKVVQITGSLAIDASPAWSPDGAWVAFASDRGPAGDFDLYVISADCTVADTSCEESARHITTDPADELDAAWAPWRSPCDCFVPPLQPTADAPPPSGWAQSAILWRSDCRDSSWHRRTTGADSKRRRAAWMARLHQHGGRRLRPLPDRYQ